MRAIIMNTEPLGGITPIGFDPDIVSSGSTIIKTVFYVILIVAGLWALWNIIQGGFEIMGAGGDAQKVANGRNRITFALVGLLVVAASWALIGFAQEVLNVNFGIGQGVQF